MGARILAAFHAQSLVGFAGVVAQLSVGLEARIPVELGGLIGDAVLADYGSPLSAIVEAAVAQSAHFGALRAFGDVADVVQ